MKKFGLIGWVAISTTMLVGQAAAQTPLKDVAHVRDGIIFTGMAYEISEQCSSIDARLFRGLSYLQSLRSHASDLGYSSAEIDAYIDDDAEKERLEAMARAQLALLGVVPGQEASYCAAGREQIAANTRVGWLLR